MRMDGVAASIKINSCAMRQCRRAPWNSFIEWIEFHSINSFHHCFELSERKQMVASARRGGWRHCLLALFNCWAAQPLPASRNHHLNFMLFHSVHAASLFLSLNEIQSKEMNDCFLHFMNERNDYYNSSSHYTCYALKLMVGYGAASHYLNNKNRFSIVE